MFTYDRPRLRPTIVRAFCGLLAVVGVLMLCAAAAPSAGATTHDYCLWSGAYSSNTAYVKCYASGENYLTNNYAWLPYAPGAPTIYCGANLGGSQYGSYTSGNPSCSHAYSGANLLKAVEYVDLDATTHGLIYY